MAWLADWGPWIGWGLFLLSEGLERSPLKSNSIVQLIVGIAGKAKALLPLLTKK